MGIHGDDVTDEIIFLCSLSRSHRLGSSICSDRLGQSLCGRLCRWGLHPGITLSSLVSRCLASPERSRLDRLHFYHQDKTFVLSADGVRYLLDSRPFTVGLALQAAVALFGCPSRLLTCLGIENSLLFAGANHSEAAPREPQAAAGAAGAGRSRRARRRARPGRQAAHQIGGRAPRRSSRKAACQAPQGHGARSERCEPSPLPVCLLLSCAF